MTVQAQKDLVHEAEGAASEAKKMAEGQTASIERLQEELAKTTAESKKVADTQQATIERLRQELEVAKAEAIKVSLVDSALAVTRAELQVSLTLKAAAAAASISTAM